MRPNKLLEAWPEHRRGFPATLKIHISAHFL